MLFIKLLSDYSFIRTSVVWQWTPLKTISHPPSLLIFSFPVSNICCTRPSKLCELFLAGNVKTMQGSLIDAILLDKRD
jgi:hypothetical protein